MKAFISWSGGKDCMYAMHRFADQSGNKVACLLNMSNAHSDTSRSHGIRNELIRRQSEKLGIPLIQQPTTREDYEKKLKEIIAKLKEEGIEAGVFGDIYLQEHRTWIERVCNDMEITAVFPLWEISTEMLIHGFIEAGYKALIVAIRKGKLPDSFLGKQIDIALVNEMKTMPNIDLCGENGEFHTFVFDGPMFKEPVPFEKGRISENDVHFFLELL